MRSTNQIMIAVSECRPCTEIELRLCIKALEGMLYFAKDAAGKMADAILNDSPSAKMRAGFWRNGRETRFKAAKKPVDEYLGVDNTPGTPEYNDRQQWAKSLFKKATGVDLDAAENTEGESDD